MKGELKKILEVFSKEISD